MARKKNEHKSAKVTTAANLMPGKVEQTYIFASFFQDHPTAMFTVIAGVVIVLTFYCNIAIYLHEKAYLEYWNIDAVHVAMSASDRFYRICGILFLLGSLWAFINALDSFLSSKKIIYGALTIFLLGFYFFSGWLLCAIRGITFVGMRSFTIMLVVTVCCVLFLRGTMNLLMGIYYLIFENTKEGAKNNQDVPRTENILNSKRMICDRDIVGKIGSLLICAALILVLEYSNGSSVVKNTSSFPVVLFDKQSYAAIYNTGERMILEECDTENGVIIQIHKEKQKIVSIEGIEYEIMDYIPESETEPPQPSESEGIAEETT